MKTFIYFSYENNFYFIFRMKTFIFCLTNSLIVHRDNNFIFRLQIANVVSFILRIENLLEGVEPEHSAETDVLTFS